MKFAAGLVWANSEVHRPDPHLEVFAFIIAIWAGTEAPRVLKGLLELRRLPPSADDTSTESVRS